MRLREFDRQKDCQASNLRCSTYEALIYTVMLFKAPNGNIQLHDKLKDEVYTPLPLAPSLFLSLSLSPKSTEPILGGRGQVCIATCVSSMLFTIPQASHYETCTCTCM
jgi:hypothetical protein